jgi:DNA-binding NarL/FixJ family response regulator
MLIPRKRTIHFSMRENPLSEREIEVMKLLGEGQTVKQAATHLGLSAKTVAAHKFNLMRKLRVHNKAQLITAAIQKRIVSLPVAV